MKNNKSIKLLSVLAVVFVLAASIVVFISSVGIEKISAYLSVFSFSDDFEDDEPFSKYNYNRLTDVEKQAYICIFEKIQSHPDYIKIPKLTKNEFNNVYFAVKNDNPHLLCFTDSCNMISFWSSAFIELNYNYSVDECINKQELLLDEIELIVSDMPDNLSDFDKELYIHDYIVETCEYKETSSASSAYGCLIEKSAVCSGYSRAAMLLLKKVGIDAVLIGGTGYSAEQGQISHMWNIVWLDKEPYHLDVTWDDSGNGISYLYFNLTDTDISVDHFDYNIDFVCDSDIYNYFKYKDLYFYEYSDSELDVILSSLIENINNGINYLEIKFDAYDVYESAAATIIDSVSPMSDMYKIISYVSANSSGKVDVSHVNFSSDNNKKYIRLMFDWN